MNFKTTFLNPNRFSFKMLACAWLFLLSALISCTSSRIMEREDGSITVLATGMMVGSTYDTAVSDAEKYCKKRGQKFILIEDETEKKGAVTIKQHVHIGDGPTGSEEHKVSLRFKCINH